MLKHETEENITDYLKKQGVTACNVSKLKRRTPDKNKHNITNIQHHFLTKITTFVFYRIIPIEVDIPNPLRYFKSQRFGHHENGRAVPDGSVCEKYGLGDLTTLHMLAKIKPSTWTVTSGS